MTDWTQLEKDLEASTPGPWIVPDQTWTRTLTVNTGGGMDAIMIPCAGSGGAMSYTDEVCTLTWKDEGEWLSNARLISRAPDLAALALAGRDAVRLLRMSRLNGHWDDHPDCTDVDATIAAFRKAEEQADDRN